MPDYRSSFNEAGRSPSAALIPMVIEQTSRGERSFDIFSRLMRDRIIFINGGIDENTAAIAVSQLLLLANENKTQPIDMYINSPGGVVSQGMAIYDTMNHLKQEGMIIRTTVIGMAASMGSVLLVAGSEGHRFAMPSAEIMIHQPSGGARGQSTDIQISAREIDHIHHRMAKLYEAHTSMTYEESLDRIERDYFLRPEEAVKLGIVDKIEYPTNLVKIAASLKEANEVHESSRHQKNNGGWGPRPAAR